MSISMKRGVASSALLALVFGGLALAPAHAAGQNVGTDQIAVEVGPDDANYNTWHQGVAGAGLNGVAALPNNEGVLLNGKNQLFTGLNGSVDPSDLEELVNTISADADSDVWFQVALFYAPEGEGNKRFTTLRKPVVDGANWITSGAIVDQEGVPLLPAQGSASVVDIVDYIETSADSYDYPVEILGVGLFSDTPAVNARASSLTVLGTTYSFVNPVQSVSSVEVELSDIGDGDSAYNEWH